MTDLKLIGLLLILLDYLKKKNGNTQIGATPPAPRGQLRRMSVAGLNGKINEIRKLIKEGKQDPFIYRLARQILQGTPARNGEMEARAIFNWVRKNIRYTGDVKGLDTFQRARRTVELRAGDCDDMTILIASLLESTGHNVKLKVVSAQGDTWGSHLPHWSACQDSSQAGGWRWTLHYQRNQ